MSARSDAALRRFTEGYNCAQSVVYAFRDRFPFDEDAALRLACGFGSGMGRKEEVCGAVSGGVLVLGATFGRGERDDSTATETTYRKTRAFIEAFEARRGSFLCRTLLGGCELTTDQGQREYKENDLFERVCKPCVQSAVEILERMGQEGGLDSSPEVPPRGSPPALSRF